jgi:hypothetical protein
MCFIDGFDYYANISDKWPTSTTATIATEYIGILPRTGRAMARVPSTTNMKRALPVAEESATLIMGAAIARGNAGSACGFFFLSDTQATFHICVYITIDGAIQVRRGNATGTLLAQSDTGVFPSAIFRYLEAKVVLGDGTAGSVEVRMDGAPVMLTPSGGGPAVAILSGIDTKNGGTKTVFDGVGLTGSSTHSCFDDLYVLNTNGSYNNDFLGDCRVETLVPVAAGGVTQLTPLSGANYTNVDELPTNTTDYVSGATIDTLDVYDMTTLSAPSAAQVRAVSATLYAAKSDTGAKSVRPVTRISGTNYDNGADIALSQSYAYINHMWEQNPATSTAWTPTTVNAAEFGAKVRP